MSIHVIFINKDGQQLSDVTSNFTSVQIPQNAFIMRVCDDSKSYSNSTLTKLFEIDNTFYSKILEYTTKGDYPYIDINVSDFGGFTAIFNQLSAQFIGNNPSDDIYDFSGYGGSSGGNIDFSTIVTALNSIATALSALTNLSNLSNLAQLANIISAIQNKDNQSDIVSILNSIFMHNADAQNGSVFKYNTGVNNTTNNKLSCAIPNLLINLVNCFLTGSLGVGSNPSSGQNLSNKLCARFLAFSSLSGTSSTTVQNFIDDSNINNSLVDISDKLQKVETKLEQNLPFVTNVYPLVETNVDFPYEVKFLNKDNCSDNKKNDI